MPHAVASHPSHLITPSSPCGGIHAERAHRDIRAGSVAVAPARIKAHLETSAFSKLHGQCA
eukprot:6779649-Prymnesium_polylepis.1